MNDKKKPAVPAAKETKPAVLIPEKIKAPVQSQKVTAEKQKALELALLQIESNSAKAPS